LKRQKKMGKKERPQRNVLSTKNTSSKQRSPSKRGRSNRGTRPPPERKGKSKRNTLLGWATDGAKQRNLGGEYLKGGGKASGRLRGDPNKNVPVNFGVPGGFFRNKRVVEKRGGERILTLSGGPEAQKGCGGVRSVPGGT